MDKLEFVNNQKLRGFKLKLWGLWGQLLFTFWIKYDHFRELEDIDMIGQCVNNVEIKNYLQS